MLAPSLDPHISNRLVFISQYENAGRPWAWLFRLFDLVGASLLGTAVYVIAKRSKPVNREQWAILILLSIIATGSFIDELFPSSCHLLSSACLVPNHASQTVHLWESIVTAGALVALNIIWVIRKAAWTWVILAVQFAFITIVVADQAGHHLGTTLIQFIYEVLTILWLANLVPNLLPKKPYVHSQVSRWVVRAFGTWLFFSGVVAIAGAILHIRQTSHIMDIYFGGSTGWLAEHGVAIGIVLMYISRHVWRGEYRAWQLSSILLWFEALKYAVLTPDVPLVLLFGLTAVLLFSLRGSFDRWTSIGALASRLKQFMAVAAVTVAVLLLSTAAIRARHQTFGEFKAHPSSFTRHLFLIDIDTSSGPLRYHLVDQALNVAGVTLLLTLLVALFRPNRPPLPRAVRRDRQLLLEKLKQSSNSSEDYFKYWPATKNYWWSSDHTAIAAYRVVGNVAFALADPVAPNLGSRKEAIKDFLAYCRQNGWLACFLMVDSSRQSIYSQAGYKLFRIGASAVVDISEFQAETTKNKWWRWVKNKAARQDWRYELACPPHSRQLMSELRGVSKTWLNTSGHQERGFALGYFDERYLQECRLHLLRDSHRLIAFANELPVYNNLSTATIDLMRFLPEANHAMPVLLALAIEQLGSEGKTQFDLGYVPLAAPDAKLQQVISAFGQILMSEAVSAKGLERFKNKFSPDWASNYLAFDGDWIDLIHVSRHLNDLLNP